MRSCPGWRLHDGAAPEAAATRLGLAAQRHDTTTRREHRISQEGCTPRNGMGARVPMTWLTDMHSGGQNVDTAIHGQHPPALFLAPFLATACLLDGVRQRLRAFTTAQRVNQQRALRPLAQLGNPMARMRETAKQGMSVPEPVAIIERTPHAPPGRACCCGWCAAAWRRGA